MANGNGNTVLSGSNENVLSYEVGSLENPGVRNGLNGPPLNGGGGGYLVLMEQDLYVRREC